MATYLITGGTGFIGRMLVEHLIDKYKEVCIILIVRDLQKAKEIYKEYLNRISIRWIFIESSIDVLALNKELANIKIDYIIHCAAPTQSAYMISHPVETADAIVLGTRNILELARRQNIKSMVYISSMEVYGRVVDTGRLRKEEELGDISLDSARSCYSLGKRMAEHYCHIYHQEYGIPVRIARLAQTFGTGVRQADNRVYMQFAKAAVNGEDIILKTDGSSMGNYCAAEDAVDAIFVILENGLDGEVYNVVNEANTMTIREMAELVVSQIAHGKIGVKLQLEDMGKSGYAPKTELRMSSEKLRELGWKPKKSMLEMYQDVINEVKWL